MLPLPYWVSAGFLGMYLLFVFGYLVFLAAMFTAIGTREADFPRFLGWFFVAFALGFLLFAIATVLAKVLAARWIKARKHRVATMVIAGLTCLEFPYGTLIGVCTLIVLERPSVKALYEGNVPSAAVGRQPAGQAYGRPWAPADPGSATQRTHEAEYRESGPS